jgi:hypothetical protein
MKSKIILLLLLTLGMAFAGCRERTDRSEGSVILSISDFDGLPVVVSASDTPPILVGQIDIRNIPKEQNGATSDLQSVELRSYEVRYTRRDTGTRVPPPTVQGVFGIVPINGSTTIENLPVLFTDQVLNPPISDLRTTGVDAETGSAVVVLNVSIRFFGRTLAGDDVATQPATFTMEVRP